MTLIAPHLDYSSAVFLASGYGATGGVRSAESEDYRTER